MKQNNRFNIISLCINIALAIFFTIALAITLMPKQKMAANNISIFIITNSTDQDIHIKAQNYNSDIVKDILAGNNETLKIPSEQLESGFITQINSITADYNNGYWWLLEINYKAANNGINQCKIEDGAVITLRMVPSSYNPTA